MTKHLTSWSVFERFEDIPGQGDLSQRLGAMGIEGLEIFTLFEPIDITYYKVPQVTSVHLPYAIDWHSAWEGRTYNGDVGDIRYFYLGTTREEMVSNVKSAIDFAAFLEPAYGVFHAANTDMRQVLSRKHADNPKVLYDFCEMMNRVVSQYPGNEPPFKLSFENLWWEGLTLRSPAEWGVFEDKLEFDNWGFTLDTGHLMNSCDGAFDEDSAVDEVMRIIDTYPKDMLDRIGSMHLQLSTSAKYRSEFEAVEYDPEGDFDAYQKKAFVHAGNIDQHRPFETKRAMEIVEAINPDYVTHELFGRFSNDRYGDIIQQRNLFN